MKNYIKNKSGYIFFLKNLHMKNILRIFEALK
ncbi:hypothetical protein IMSAGC001_03940 [Bacteroides acidifaciens]|mgnify:FL=1|uniref:Uncharacterized protein n=1 Tax=Bacteroides acidifaciens TaxID=85831 RepID=A0A7J0A866_9BACE|nr:hypothetical protein IMSAGC001_03940 [Bacteroides acidifaciens]